MCLILPSRIVSMNGTQVEIELPDGVRSTVDASLAPEARLGDYVLVDRGLVLKVIDAAEAETILEIYAEFGSMMAEA